MSSTSKGTSSKSESKSKSESSSQHRKSSVDKSNKKSSKEKGIDGNSGTSFADALGMCAAPPTKKKKDKESSSSSSGVKSHKSSSSSSKKRKRDKIELPDSSDVSGKLNNFENFTLIFFFNLTLKNLDKKLFIINFFKNKN